MNARVYMDEQSKTSVQHSVFAFYRIVIEDGDIWIHIREHFLQILSDAKNIKNTLIYDAQQDHANEEEYVATNCILNCLVNSIIG